MTRIQTTLALLATAAVAALGSARWATTRAQDRLPSSRATRSRPERPEPDALPGADEPTSPPPSVADAMLRPLDLPFGDETTLDDVAVYLHDRLRAPVVLDRAALKRLDLTGESTIRLELEGVRLKNGLKLLLDQVGMAYKVVPEDNLLILTDPKGADEPMDRVLKELESLHRDVHDLQDAVEEVYQFLADEGAPEPEMRKPTMIEELPPAEDAEPEPPATKRPKPG